MTEGKQIWLLNVDYASKSNFKQFNKRHPNEYRSCFANLKKVKGLLESGCKVGGFQIGFFRAEGEGLYRIGQSKVRGAKETRLYVYPSEQDKRIYILRIGTKDSQQADMRKAKGILRQIKEGRDGHGQK